LIEQPSYGYELKQRYEERFESWLPSSDSHLYKTLERLRDEHLIEQVAVEPSGMLQPRARMRQEYQATAAGLREYRGWISVLMSDGFQRTELLVRIVSSGMLGIGEMLAIVELYQENCLRQLSQLEVPDVEHLAGRTTEEIANLLVAERQRRELQAERDWATWARRVIRTHAQSDRSKS
jgi:DNA-binding PadR family transcriptional regulator